MGASVVPVRSVPEMEARMTSYMQILVEFAPLFLLAFSVVVLRGLRGVGRSYTTKGFMNRFVNLVLSSVMSAVLVVGSVAIVPVLYPEISDSALVGITIFLAVGGMRLIDAIVFKRLGIHLVDSAELKPGESEWLLMTSEEREQCVRLWRERRKGESGEQ